MESLKKWAVTVLQILAAMLILLFIGSVLAGLVGIMVGVLIWILVSIYLVLRAGIPKQYIAKLNTWSTIIAVSLIMAIAFPLIFYTIFGSIGSFVGIIIATSMTAYLVDTSIKSTRASKLIISNKDKIIIIAIMLVLSILIFIISFKFELKPTIDTLFWTFSTIAQSLLALVAFVGILVLFKLQKVDVELSRLCEIARVHVRDFKGTEADGYSTNEIKEACDEMAPHSDEQHPGLPVALAEIKRLQPRIKNLSDRAEKIKNDAAEFLAIVISATSLSLILLPLSATLNKMYGGYSGLTIAIFLSVWAILKGYDFAKDLLINS